MTWILVIYMTSGFGSGSTGGPMAIDGFKSIEKCHIAQQRLENSSFKTKIDKMECISLNK